MAESLSKAPSDYLSSVSAEAGETFRALRNALLDCGPLDRSTCELAVAIVGPRSRVQDRVDEMAESVRAAAQSLSGRPRG